METLNQYFSYNKDYNDMINAYRILYKKMKIIHDNGMQVPYIDSNHILYDGTFSFDSMVLSQNIEVGKRENLLSLTKLFLGTYLSLSTEFRDFSQVDNEWFSSNIDSISNSVTEEDYPKEYFLSVLLNGENLYFSDYLDKIERENSYNSMSNKNVYKKVLSNAGSSLYQDNSINSNNDNDNEFSSIEKKSAFINIMFYPVLITSILLICFVLHTCFKYLNG